jgi:hypothetical protein
MKMPRKTEKPDAINETVRTIILLILLAVAIGFIYWSQGQYQQNFIESF